MSACNDAYTLTRGSPTGARSLSIVAAAIAAVCVLSGVPVIQQLVDSRPAHATTAATASTWDLQARWWPGEVRPTAVLSAEMRPSAARPGEAKQVNRQASTVPESDLTFTKGYSLRLAAREATSAARPATSGPSSASQFGRPAVVRTAATFAPTEAAPNLRRVSAARIDPRVDRPGPADVGSHALAFGEQRASQRGFAEPQSGPFGFLFANLP
jgi:hypothetical protein